MIFIVKTMRWSAKDTRETHDHTDSLYHAQIITVDGEQVTRKQRAMYVARNWKNGDTDYFFRCDFQRNFLKAANLKSFFEDHTYNRKDDWASLYFLDGNEI